MEIDWSKANLSEKDIENYLFENPECVNFSNSSGNWYTVSEWMYRQFSVPSGIIDLFGVLNDRWPVVVEVKNVAIDAKAIAQVCRYAKDMSHILYRREPSINYEHVCRVVVGTAIDDQAIYECNACNVVPIVFKTHFYLDINQMGWNDKYKGSLTSRYNTLAQDNLLDRFDNFLSVPEEEQSSGDDEETQQEENVTEESAQTEDIAF